MDQFIAKAIAEYLEALNANAPKHDWTPDNEYRLSAKPGKKYTRIVKMERDYTVFPTARSEDGYHEGSVHAFLENATGKIYKPAGWTGPVKYGAAYDVTVPAQFQSLLEDASQKHAFAGGYLYSGAQSWRRAA